MDTRVTPAVRKARKRPASTDPGFASSVISVSFAMGQRFAIRSSTAATVSGSIRLGVPPPKKTVFSTRPGSSSATRSISVR